MKVGRLVCVLPLLASVCSIAAFADTPPSAQNVLKTAESQAGKENKNVLLIFHASWCSWCHKLDGLLNNPDFKPGFDSSYEIVHITVQEDPAHKADENPGGAEMLTKLHGDNEGIPFYVVFSPRGKILGDSRNPKNIGYPGEPSEIAHFMDLMQKTSHMSADQLAALRSFLSKKG